MKHDDHATVDGAEWAAQEHGRQHAAHAGDRLDSAAEVDYLHIAMALRSLPRSAPPPDFTRAVMRQLATPNTAVDTRLLPLLLGALALVCAAMLLLFGAHWWQLLHQHLGSEGIGWVSLVGTCMLVSRVCRRWLRLPMQPAAESRQPQP